MIDDIMERKIATYSEKNVRLQLVSTQEKDSSWIYFELRLNRKVIHRWSNIYVREARLYFLSAVHNIMLNRSSDMSYLT